MTFYCKECGNEFDIDDKICEGYYNWKCPSCDLIAVKKDMSMGFGIIWNCDTGTTKKKSYIDPASSCSTDKKNACAGCPNAG